MNATAHKSRNSRKLATNPTQLRPMPEMSKRYRVSEARERAAHEFASVPTVHKPTIMIGLSTKSTQLRPLPGQPFTKKRLDADLEEITRRWKY
jgi:hypothetical protein